jgi:hypothetical protein
MRIESFYDEKLVVLGANDVQKDEVSQLYHGLVEFNLRKASLASSVNSELYEKYIGREILGPGTARDRVVRQQYFLQLAEGLLDLPYFATSYGVFIPSYLSALKEQQVESDGQSEYRSLLVGAETPETVIEFAQTTQAIFPQAECTVIDIASLSPFQFPENQAEYKEGYFQYPKEIEPIFDSVQTNLLISNYMTYQNFPWTQEPELFRSSFGRLKPGGKLIMIENVVNGYHKEARLSWLEKAGFVDIRMDHALAFKGRREIDQWLNNRSDQKILLDPYNNLLTTAKKPN